MSDFEKKVFVFPWYLFELNCYYQSGKDGELVSQQSSDHDNTLNIGMPSEAVAQDSASKKMLELAQQQQQQDSNKELLETFLSLPENMREEFVKQQPLQKFVDQAVAFHKEWEKAIEEYKKIVKIPRELNAQERDEFYENFIAFEDNNTKITQVVNDVVLDKLYP